jgi:hydroxymethylglutaryl-CoA lyase
MNLPNRIDLREVGLRDGLQLESPITLTDKLAMLEAIVATGVRRVEVTSFVSPKAVPALADADQLAAELHRWPEVRFSALIANLRGAHRAIKAGITDLEYVISASDSHSYANAGRTTTEATSAIDGIARVVHGADGALEVIVATAWDCPFDGITDEERVLAVVRSAIEQGADRLCLADTIGTVTPGRLLDLLDRVRAQAPGVEIGVHLHNTRGTGQANALAAILGGVRQLDASVGGLGGCPFAPGATGNIATEELVYWLEDSGVDCGLDLDAVLTAVQVTEAIVGHPIPSSLYRAGGRSVPRGSFSGVA